MGVIVNNIDPEKIRNIIRDKEELNVLLSYEEQFSDEEIYSAAEDVEEIINIHYPSLKNANIPMTIANYYVIAILMDAVAAQELRNQMRIDDDNVGNIDYSNKAQQYLSVSDYYRGKAKRLLQTYAASSYYSNMWGDVASNSLETEYGNV
jgi:hypothetical protein